jgi:dolichol-phosphate mannosyltransferase/undecaprenyl-phosphate 4-deoxy-4-formamido-L-arabinose transferase
MLISVVIPVYNTVEGLDEMARRIEAVFEQRPDDDWELIFVDDCSPNPNTWPALERVEQIHAKVRLIQLTRNFGQQAATLAGLDAARGDLVLTMDDDFQHNPDDIPRLLDEADHDIVIGQFQTRHHSLFKRFTSWLKGWFDWLLIGRPRHIRTTSFRCLKRTVVDGMLQFRTPHPFVPALMFHVSRDIKGVDVRHQERREEQSGYTLGKLLSLFSNLIINNSAFLLRLVGGVGFLTALASFAMVIWVFWRNVAHGVPVMGWSSLMAAVLLLGGMILLSIGLTGEYLIRAIEASEGKPCWSVRRRVGFDREGPGE